MSDTGKVIVIAVAFMAMILSVHFSSYELGYRTAREDVRKEAVKAGVGEWIIDGDNHEKTFRFKSGKD